MTDALPETMTAVVTMGVGGPEQLQLREVPVPSVGPRDVLLRVLAAGINNTDINTRVGWYDSPGAVSAGQGAPPPASAPGGYNGATTFPLIQGADCCGIVVAAGGDVVDAPIGRRALIRSCMTGVDQQQPRWLGTDCDGAFAEYVVVPATEVFPLLSDWSDAEVATIPCAYGTAENMVQRSGLGPGDRVLVTGASGGVGSAVLQLARRRGAEVIAVASARKHDAMRSLGASHVVDRNADLQGALGGDRVDIVFDNVAGPGFGGALGSLRQRGTYVTSGAIAGPTVELDLRTLYLNDLRLVGTTTWNDTVFADVVSYVERDEIRPLLAATFPLADIAAAQERFRGADRVGNVVVVPSSAPDAD
ncbi:zinc-binding dehydrogenase [Marisediminicola sp. LYQ134]|uniref:zinc-binding dehydrogenase n=1 Tax=Marisediminicola sp. LYQ134 TaxID=3391061 RepID=UPI0039834E58